MAAKTTFLVQSFEMNSGRLMPGAKEIAPTENAALTRAEALSSRLPGVAVVRITADEETGELHTVTVVGTFGRIPGEFAETLL